MAGTIDYTNPDNLENLTRAFSDRHGSVRQEAREALVAVGPAAVPVLAGLLKHDNHRVRWEAAKALEELGIPEAAPALVAALEDDESDIRWLGANGLIYLGRDGIVPLLKELMNRPESVQLHDGAHHVVRELVKGGHARYLEPVLQALDGLAPGSEVPTAAEKALEELNALG